MKRFDFRRFFRRLEAAGLAAATVWFAAVTAGSADFAAVGQALRSRAPRLALQWELGDLRPDRTLSTAVLLTLAQSPLLLSARDEIAELWRQSEAEPDPQPQHRPVPVQEEPAADAAPAGVDNGVPAKTLIPSDPAGYTVCGRVYVSTSTSYTLSAEELQKPFAAELTPEEPQILILHTHGSEAYTPAEDPGVVWSGDHRTTDSRYNVVRMGDVMAETLGQAGLSVLHDRTLYDYPNYSGAYDRALIAIEGYLRRYPSIRFVLDVHRDAVEDGSGNQCKLVSDVGEPGTAAQIGLVVGSDGSGLEHPHWMENLRLAVAIQQRTLEDYPTLMRPVLLRKSRYNQHVTTGSLLVEVGAAGNAPEEAELAARLFARCFADTLQASREQSRAAK